MAGDEGNQAVGSSASVTGGALNVAADPPSAISVGCYNSTGTAALPDNNTCMSQATESITGGFFNTAGGQQTTITGRESAFATRRLSAQTKALIASGSGDRKQGRLGSVLAACR